MFLQKAKQEKQETAHAFFLQKCWDGSATPGELLDLAEAAELSVEQADKQIAEIERAKADLQPANELPKLRKILKKALAESQRITSGNEARIEALQNEIEAADDAVIEPHKAATAAEAAARRLYGLQQRGLLPGPLIPRAVLEISERDERTTELHKAQAAVRELLTRRRKQMDAIERIKAQLHEIRPTVHIPQDLLQNAESKLVEIDGELVAARRVVEALKPKIQS